MTQITEAGMNAVLQENFYEEALAKQMFEDLTALPFYKPIYEVNGRKISPRRKIYGMGDMEYEYSGITVTANEWSPAVLKMKQDLEAITKTVYNFALLNYYEDGECKLSMHREKEEFLEKNCPLVTISLGETRQVTFRRKNYTDVVIPLNSGAALLMYHPTNQHFSHGIAEDPTVKGATITISFKKIKPVCMPFKKPKLDWMDKAYQLMNRMEPSYIKISSSAYVVIKEFQDKFYVDIRQFDEVNGKLIPTKKGVMLTASEWCEFIEKLREFDFIYVNHNAITSNLLLLNLNERLHLQQINVTDDFLVHLKFSYIKFWNFEVDLLLEKIPQINKIMMDCLWNEFFPRIFSKMNDESQLMPCDEDTMKSVFQIVLETHLAPILRKRFVCQGCLVSSNSQLNHDCLNLSAREQYEKIPNILMFVDIYKLITELTEKRLFTNEFILKSDITELDTILFSASHDDM